MGSIGSAPRSWSAHLPAGLDAVDVDLIRWGTLPARWIARWAANPTQPVLHTADTGWVTADQLEDRTRRAAYRLAGAGVEPGAVVLVSGRTGLDFVVASIAVLRLGAILLPVNPEYRPGEMHHLVVDAQPQLVVTDNPTMGELPLSLSGPGVDVAIDRARPDDPALLCYTSGTTGRPKGAQLLHTNLLASAEAVVLAWRWTPDDRLILALPLFHMHGLGVGIFGTLTAGASAVILPRFGPDPVLDAIGAHHGTLFFGVPTMYHRLAQSSRLEELAGLRLCVSGSAPMAPDLHHAVAAGARQRVLERYGMTETVMLVSNPYDGERRPGAVGFPLPGVDLRLDPSNAEVLVRGPNVFDGYRGRPDDTAESFTDGWFRTGDIGAVDDDGYLRLVGRAKELIISGGVNVYPREVEDVLRQHPAVADVAVTGTPDPQWGEVVTAWVIPADQLATDEVLAFAAEHLAPAKRPRRLEVVDDLPRNALGKVLRHELGRDRS